MDDMSVVAVKILCIYKDFHSGILKLFKVDRESCYCSFLLRIKTI